MMRFSFLTRDDVFSYAAPSQSQDFEVPNSQQSNNI